MEIYRQRILRYQLGIILSGIFGEAAKIACMFEP